MALSFSPQSCIHLAKMCAALHGYAGHVIQCMAQAGVTTATHHHLSALATLLRDGSDPTMRTQDLIVPFGQRLGGFGKQPSSDLATDPGQGLHNRDIGWSPGLTGFRS